MQGGKLVELNTLRFGSLHVDENNLLSIPGGLLGFPEIEKFCLLDTGDDTFILWLQSVARPEIAFPVLEPKIFRPDYIVRLSAQELADLELQNLSQSAVYSILTIPDDVSQMTANLKAPIVLNLKTRTARQVVLQENDYSIRQPMFKELRAHIVTLQNTKRNLGQEPGSAGAAVSVVPIELIPPALTVRNLK